MNCVETRKVKLNKLFDYYENSYTGYIRNLNKIYYCYENIYYRDRVHRKFEKDTLLF